MFLTDEELTDMTGLRRANAMRRWLDRQGIPYIVGADGRPRVLRAVIMERLGGQAAPAAPEPRLRLRNA